MSTFMVSVPRRVLTVLVHGYRLLLRPLLQPSCRYEPSCSAYALEALDRHGAGAGSYLALHRLLRCHPFCPGGVDPVPQHPPALFTRFTRGHPARPRAEASTSATSTSRSFP
jgi:putative membrane protein insertion efficiency factor